MSYVIFSFDNMSIGIREFKHNLSISRAWYFQLFPIVTVINVGGLSFIPIRHYPFCNWLKIGY